MGGRPQHKIQVRQELQAHFDRWATSAAGAARVLDPMPWSSPPCKASLIIRHRRIGNHSNALTVYLCRHSCD